MKSTKRKITSRKGMTQCNVVDLFCGVGGLTHGLRSAGLKIVAGIDFDDDCEFAFTHNNDDAKFFCRDVASLSPSFIQDLYPDTGYRVLSGCAPCQPFSRYGRGAMNRRSKWSLLLNFGALVESILPDLVTIENVPELQAHDVFKDFLDILDGCGYQTTYAVLYGPDFGVPQSRRRLVLISSRHGAPHLPQPTHDPETYPTVRDAIGMLPPIESGCKDGRDNLHRACTLSNKNLKRIRASVPGGSWRDWPKSLRSNCHKSQSGATYPSVYGRMEWDKPAPTITTQFFGYGNGRFGHPEQDRALSLREGAILQSFPSNYSFHPPSEYFSSQKLGQLIGNAVPVRLGQAIGSAILEHLKAMNS